MIKILNLFTFFFLSFSGNTLAGDIRAGNMRVEQLSQKTVKVTVNIYTHVHADPVQMELCWGDGNCEQWSSSLVEEWPEIDTRHYQMETFHAYQQEEQYEISIESCCWAGDLINLSSSEENDFKLKTTFTFSGNNTAQRNTTPTVNPFFAICPLTACAYSPEVTDEEGDSLSWSLCLPDLEGYFALDEVAQSPSNIVIFNKQLGQLSWVSPPFEGFYSHVACLSEYRAGVLISQSEFFTLLVINNSLPIVENLLPTFLLVPNPVEEVLFLKGLDQEWQEGDCEVYNSLGKRIYAQQGISPIETANWSSGIYFLILNLDGQKVIRKFLK